MKRVLITGMGVVSPNGIGKKAFREALLKGVSGIRRIESFDPSPLACQIAGEVSLNGEVPFSKKELRNLPRVTQLSVVSAEEALEDSKIKPSFLSQSERETFGVFVGTGGGSVEFMERHYQIYYGKKHLPASLYAISASTAGNLSSELSIRFGLQGPSQVVTTGCTSSTDTLGLAFREIQSGRLQWALVGGADAPITEGVLYGFEQMKILSSQWNQNPSRASRPFSKDRDGFVLAEGAWFFILEEKEHAARRGARAYAEILGYGSSCEAFHAVRLNGEMNFRAISLALKDAGLPPDAIQYVNLHGTGTVLNDRVETRAMKKVFGRRAHKIPMSSTKSMIGHPQGASGAAGLSATLLCLEEKKIHPTMNLEIPDPECDLDYVANETREAEVEYVLCHTLGFGSRSSALLLRNLSSKL